jgi:uncharacterized protein (TIGR02757 family)
VIQSLAGKKTILNGDKRPQGEELLRHLIPRFEETYAKYNRREFISPDPLETLYMYSGTRDREIAGIVVSSIAYGRVAQILKSARRIFPILGPSPSEYLKSTGVKQLEKEFSCFRHRFSSGREIARYLAGIGSILREYGSIENCLSDCLERASDVLDGLTCLAEKLRERSGLGKNFLVPSPRDGSACKRFFLYIKWMTRSDDVDPGGWTVIRPSDLIIPMDVHMFRICSSLGLTKRKTADLKSALEATELFRKVMPEDPVKYDFVLTRFGIRSELDEKVFVDLCLEGDDHVEYAKEQRQ